MNIAQISLETLALNLGVSDVIELRSISELGFNEMILSVIDIKSILIDNQTWIYSFTLKNHLDAILQASIDHEGGYISLSRMINIDDAFQVLGSELSIEWAEEKYELEPSIMECLAFKEDYRSIVVNNPEYRPEARGDEYVYRCFHGERGHSLIDFETSPSGETIAYITLLLPAYEAIKQILGTRRIEV